MTSSEMSQDAKPKKAANGFMSALATFGRILRGRKHKSTFYEYAEALIVAVAMALFIRTFAFQAFRIPSVSMEDTLLVGDYLFVNKFLYGAEIPFTGGTRLPAIRQPNRGDIIVFRNPEKLKEDYIKRCVAVEGDRIEYRDKVLYINGEPVSEEYTVYRDGSRMRPDRDYIPEQVVPKGMIFMMGDNRDRSSDSREWGFLDKKLIRGKAEFIYWSWDSGRTSPRITRIFDLIR